MTAHAPRGGTIGRVFVNLTVSLDGFVAGPNDGPGNGLGDGGSPLFDWWTAGSELIAGDERFRPPERSREFVLRAFDVGAIITGRRTFDIAGGWAGHHPIGAPFFLLTHRPVERWVGPGTGGTVVDGGVERALELARAAAGERDIAITSASVAQQFLRAGLLDEIQLNLVPLLLGGGVPLLANLGPEPPGLTCVAVVPSDGVTHLSYAVSH